MRERVGEAASSFTQRAGEMAGNARDRVGDFGHGARERIGDLGSRARDRGRGGLEHAMQDYPLALAAGAALLGLGLGLLVPESEHENQLMGRTRDDLLNRAQNTAERVKVAAVEATHEVREAVRDEVASRGPGIKSAIQGAVASVGAQLKDAAGRLQEEARQAAQDSISGGDGKA